ncbi:hypothetical protein D3C77_113720 [compost metagenome]
MQQYNATSTASAQLGDSLQAIKALLNSAPNATEVQPASASTISTLCATVSATLTLSTIVSAGDSGLNMAGLRELDAARRIEIAPTVPDKVVSFDSAPQGAPMPKHIEHNQQSGALLTQGQPRKKTDRNNPGGGAKSGGTKVDRESRELLRYISEDFVMLAARGGAVAYHIESGDELGKEGFKHYCAKHYGDIVLVDNDGNEKRVDSGDIWWNWNDPERRVVRRIVMEPTSLPENDDNPELYNRWHVLKHTMVEPDRQATMADMEILLAHLMYISDEDPIGVSFFLNWLAQLYQTPEIKMPTAILMYSRVGGVGKSMLFKLFQRVFGPPMVGSCSGKALSKGFDDVIEHKRLLVVNEMARSDKADSYESFKNLISEDHVSFEGKGRAAKDIRNITHFVVTTNNLDALPLMRGDRRIAVLVCNSERQPDAYYKALAEWIDGPGPAIMAHVLEQWKFPTEWDPHAPVPQTKAARIMQDAAQGELFDLVQELIEERRPPFDRDLIVIDQACAQLDTLYQPSLRVRPNRTSLGSVLKSLTGDSTQARVTYQNGVTLRPRLYCLRNSEQWTLATPEQRGAHLEQGTRLFPIPADTEVNGAANHE